MTSKKKIAIIGLGYVGLPLARLFATKYFVIGFDIDDRRVKELNSGLDKTLEISNSALKSVLLKKNETNTNGLFCSSNLMDISSCNYFIVTVPTPVDKNNRPILRPLLKASEFVGGVLKKGDTVIYESTVYPGATEEDCIPVLEKISKLKFNKDFYVGYSPERINPGDKEHTVEKIIKVTSGSTAEAAKEIDYLYNSVITAGTHLAPSIKIAEASKVIENSQRDINIAFVNELAKIFGLMGIDTKEVLKASQTKWNFLHFMPGLVGGHCIGVDPYYLAQKAQEYGYHPEIILSGRRLNDSMGKYVASEVIKTMVLKDIPIRGSQSLVLGITFKENCPDIRNTRVIDVVSELETYGIDVCIYDPLADRVEAEREYGLDIMNVLPNKKFDSIVLCVSHQEFREINFNLVGKDKFVLYDVKSFLAPGIADSSL